jgi:peroxiredoxin Q/BCP
VVVTTIGFVLPDTKKSAPATARTTSGLAPAFSERDVVSGRPLTNSGLRGKNVLLFFSEGVMCQACFEQIQSLQARAGELKARHLLLVNITTDPPGGLRQAAAQYGITSPLISDENGDMSTTYEAIGRGMHPNTDGHTFVLVDKRGQIRWRRDYQTMFVPPQELFAAIPNVN